MTAKELIEQLQQLPPDTHVFTSGYEGGLEDCSEAKPEEIIDVALKYNDSRYEGPHTHLFVDWKYKAAKERNLAIVKGIVL